MMEPRSFAEVTPVGEFLRVNPTGLTDRQVLEAALQQAEATHGCLEKHIAETKLAHLDATEKRIALAGKLEEVTMAVGSLETRQGITEGSVSALAKSLGASLPAGAKPIKVEAPMSWKDIAKVVAGVLGSITGSVFVYQAIVTVFPTFHHWIMSLSPT